MSLLTDAAYRRGITRLTDHIAAAEQRGETLEIRSDLRLYATTGRAPRPRPRGGPSVADHRAATGSQISVRTNPGSAAAGQGNTGWRLIGRRTGGGADFP